jgi:protocatechuate 3,4-dioxygenase beta subunit
MSALIGAGGAALFSGHLRASATVRSEGAGACIVRPRHIEGPYFVDGALRRSDIRSDPISGAVKHGVPLRLTFRVTQTSGGRCLPLTGARVDVWHCDAAGRYSDTKEWQESTLGQKFLRGYQLTDRKGLASFSTIFPGWYPNRAVHIHFKIRTEPKGEHGTEFTSQIYFDDVLTDEIHAQQPYAQHGARKVRNDRDLLFLFRGSRLVLPLREEKKGYVGTFDIALDLD